MHSTLDNTVMLNIPYLLLNLPMIYNIFVVERLFFLSNGTFQNNLIEEILLYANLEKEGSKKVGSLSLNPIIKRYKKKW